ncbi:YdbH domain-containing protein [Nitrincola alkalilacustris]|uniref:YdbH domain-containing protein n=1 Tax=Nitrincola alkalilacustris TaxID=1571224 RepID=UPI00124CDA76|nr:YdbH domain-containing protein [Nitrincola alkalilacustris]
MRKLILLLALLPLLLAALSYAALPYLARNAIEHWFAEQGFSETSFAMTHPRWDQIEVSHLAFTQEQDGRRMQLEADSLVVMFDPLNLLLTQELTEVRVAQANLTIEADSSIPKRIEDELSRHNTLSLPPELPASLFAYAPSQRLIIGQLNIRYQAEDTPLASASGFVEITRNLFQSRMAIRYDDQHLGYADLTLDRDLAFTTRLHYLEETLYRAAGNFEPSGDDWIFSLSHQLDLSRIQQWINTQMPELSVELPILKSDLTLGSQIRFPQLLPLDPTTLLQTLDIEIGTLVDIQIQHPDLGELNSRIQGSAQLKAGDVSINLAPTSRVLIRKLSQADMELIDLEVTLMEALQISGPLAEVQDWQRSSLSARVKAASVKVQGVEKLQLEPIAITLQPASLNSDLLKGRITLPAITASLEGRELPSASLGGEFTFNIARQQLSSKLLIKTLELPIEINADLSAELTGKAEIDWQLTPFSIQGQYPLFRRFIPELPAELAFHQGRLSANGRFIAQDNTWTLTSRQQVTDLHLSQKETHLEGINWRSELQYNSQGQLRDAGEVNIRYINIGLPVGGPSLGYQFNMSPGTNPLLRLTPSYITLLGGKINLPGIEINPLQLQSTFLIGIDGIRLTDVLELYAQQGLYGEGVITGQLPITISDGQISISSGFLQSVEPGGVIRYTPDAALGSMAAGNFGLRMAFEALTDMQFSLLHLTLDYEPSGDAHLVARIQGRNPDWQDGRPIDLTISIEENILDLLKALQLTGRITDRIDQHFRQ